MGKKRTIIKPQGTFEVDEVVALYLGLWAMGDALLDGDMKLARKLHTKLFGLIPNTSTNTGAFVRARSIHRKLRLDKEQAASKEPARRFEELPYEEKVRALTKLREIEAGLLDNVEITNLRTLWGDEQ